jgi:hypothetical protein
LRGVVVAVGAIGVKAVEVAEEAEGGSVVELKVGASSGAGEGVVVLTIVALKCFFFLDERSEVKRERFEAIPLEEIARI